MTDNNSEPNPPSSLPTDLIETLNQLDESELRAVIDYAQQRYEFVHPAITDQIEAAPGEEIVQIEEQPTYTRVVKRQPCATGCDDCPHGPFLYHVHEETRPGGETKLRWRYLGSIAEN